MILLLLGLVSLYLIASSLAALFVVMFDFEPALFRPSLADRILVSLVLPWGFFLTWADGDDPWDWLAYAWRIVAQGEYLDD
ncbi:hypothetical protein ACQZ6C_10715 [Rhizobium rhizogenes]